MHNGDSISTSRPASLVANRVGSAAAGAALAFGALCLCLRNLGQSGIKDWIFWVPLTLLVAAMSALCWWRSTAVNSSRLRGQFQPRHCHRRRSPGERNCTPTLGTY